jgi:serpin B
MRIKWQLWLSALMFFIICVEQTNADDITMIKQRVNDNTAFALDLYNQLRTARGNFFFSPFSISTALAMTYAGARENTARQMAVTLHFTEAPNLLHRSMGKVLTQLNSVQQQTAVELRVANALWAQKGYKFRDEFIRIVHEAYQAELTQVDFRAASEAVRQSINAWVENQTDQKIKDLIQPGVLNALTRLVLVNAVYFKGFWDIRFKPADTREMEFWLSEGGPVKLPMMHQKHEFGYWENEWLQVLEMPYKNGSLSLIILLTKEKAGISALEKKLTLANTINWQNQLRQRKIVVFLPRFKIESEFSLNQTLTAMGMPDAFNPASADFSAMVVGKKELYISAVIHKAFIEVNEEGTEAAAATGVVVGVTSIAPSPPVFKADHPFVFFIRDNASQSILFLGRVANPQDI